jgi:hypothetical protein
MNRDWGLVDIGGGLDDGHVVIASLDANSYRMVGSMFYFLLTQTPSTLHLFSTCMSTFIPPIIRLSIHTYHKPPS